jgi:hypothetical protein
MLLILFTSILSNLIYMIQKNTMGLTIDIYQMLHSNYVIKSVSDLRQVSGFLRELRFPPPIKLITFLIPDHIIN